MDYAGFINNSAENTLSQVNDLKINNFTSPKTPGFKTAARKEANKTQCLITELEQSGTQERMCPTVDSCSRLNAETQFQLSKKLYQLHEAVAQLFDAQASQAKEQEKLRHDLTQKVNQHELESKLLLKANKQSVANALQRKANRNDIEQMGKLISELSKG
jgi:hypothetical protein